jgi:EAL domain-containing protein (putative c-di-GMP-specific phosphodiesterase class I)
VDVCTIVSSVIRMAHCLHLRVVAKGVETLQQRQCPLDLARAEIAIGLFEDLEKSVAK